MLTFATFDFINTILFNNLQYLQKFNSIVRPLVLERKEIPRMKLEARSKLPSDSRNKDRSVGSEIGRQTSRFEMLSAHTREIHEGVKRPKEIGVFLSPSEQRAMLRISAWIDAWNRSNDSDSRSISREARQLTTGWNEIESNELDNRVSRGRRSLRGKRFRGCARANLDIRIWLIRVVLCV